MINILKQNTGNSMNEKGFKSGFVSVLGRPNVGKSTLINFLLGEKISIVTPKPQTTRHKITAILTTEKSQIILLDTPGLHKGKKEINRLMMEQAFSALTENDMENITSMGDKIVGKIITVQCSGLSKNNKGEKSLLHPRFMCIREDKCLADSLEKIEAIEEMCSTLGE